MQDLIKNLLIKIGENPNREGLVKTPERVQKSYEFLCSGYTKNPKEILNEAIFNTDNNEMVLVKDIDFYSLCEHHLLPFFGKVHIAYIPNGKVVGLSKLPRLVEVYSRRLQIQEQLCEQISLALYEILKPKGVAVTIEAEHLCMQMRGIQKVNSKTITSSLKGIFLSDERTRKEFYSLIK
ncbi:GTP cyclohydrolase I FolE [Campylobacter sp. RM12640]|uniref:GTP cyclohydrolase I FolE n=1 Tax=unclassified Campylobacter TaxID=2593542 RepID=UPI001BD9B273|nr:MULTISPECIES: GTP cyclohydrolase I FolE [unclassified Campylobacter]MBZ7975393.1 GTP cyclohydrolase I FolE [Campylobacter sp. RM12637]MBZ7977226.1 GTP cyclohydrolase I FolE [Campylobacter sp. RM12654]MBZ7979122.1 GTP cyclohydrolase I FolE [Campylobacter sp. RM12642]MBZ7981738.1 GTP cyclohydrolase I FolE [Campylobacter sp. RM12640]MBZ7983132.1 GTP cyclohydrolase I FolE [Campylobacter sp. RM12647]MBZ7988616.1 GTP cyclohydrolase I FolE [Campylobacter sp. RM12635]MBZ7992693.1 GTP cyclohydrola